MAKKSNEEKETVERLDKQEETIKTKIDNTNTDTKNLNIIQKIYTIKELCSISFSKDVTMNTILNLLIKYDNDMQKVVEIINNAKNKAVIYNVSVDDIILYDNYLVKYTTQNK